MKSTKTIGKIIGMVLFGFISVSSGAQIISTRPSLINFSESALKEEMVFVKSGILGDKEEEVLSKHGEGVEPLSMNKKNTEIRVIDHLTEDPQSTFVTFEVKNFDEKNYLHWVVSKDEKNGIFIVERSENGVEFIPVGYKKRISSGIPQLSYYLPDENIPAGNLEYRILALGEDGTYKYSQTIKSEKMKISSQPYYY